MNNKQNNKDKEILENIDRVAAGEKLQNESGLDKDTKAALEYTREMASWSKSPSKEFKALLKADITHRVVEQQNKESLKAGNPEYRGFLRRPAWLLTFSAAVMVIVWVIIVLIVYLVNR
jgi:Flp pilus assembly protein TadB